MSEQITLYTAKVCPYAHRAEIALAEAKVPFTRYEIDLLNKPDWYAPKVNPASKVPAIAYGGPAVPADTPSPSSTKLAESLVLVEFIGDLFPASGIVPRDPVARAQARFFVEGVSSRLTPALFALQTKNAPAADLYAALEYLQALLPPEGFAVGAYSIADIAITPFLARARLGFTHDLGAWPVGEGPKIWAEITGSGKFARLAKYTEDVLARESFKATWDEPHLLEGYKKHLAGIRK